MVIITFLFSFGIEANFMSIRNWFEKDEKDSVSQKFTMTEVLEMMRNTPEQRRQRNHVSTLEFVDEPDINMA